MVYGKKCAAVILNYNDADNAIGFANSIKDYSTIDYIIIVDNNSTDDSWEVLTDLAIDKVHVFKTEKNGGYGYGNNYGVKLAKKLFACDIAFICNTDIRIDSQTVDAIAKFLATHNDTMICSTIQINGFTNKMISPIAWNVPSTLHYLRSSLIVLKHIIPRAQYVLPAEDVEFDEVECVPGAFLAIDINKFLECGGYDEGVFLFCEESIVGAKAKHLGYKTYLYLRGKYYHYHSSSINKNLSSEIAKFKILLKSRRYYLVNYRHVRGVNIIAIDVIFKIAIAERYLTESIYKCLGKNDK